VSQDNVVRHNALPQSLTVSQLQQSGASGLALSITFLVAVPLLALNLRPAVTSMGTALAQIQSDTGMSATLASAVVAAPVWCFALGGGIAWSLRVRWGTAKTVAIALTVLTLTLGVRVIGGPVVLLGGTILACLAIAVLGTMLPAIVHAAPPRVWATLTGSYIAALGSGSAVGALITPQITDHTSWQLGASSWALLAGAGLLIWRVASRRLPEKPVPLSRKKPTPTTLRPVGTAWTLTIHFGLTSGVTFTIMGWLPSILLDRAHVPPHTVGWMFTVAMALGVPFALMVPHWARSRHSQTGLGVALALPTLVAIAGLLFIPAGGLLPGAGFDTVAPWVWAIGLGLGMPAVGLGLTMISLRADSATDTAAALSSMVQGFGYAIAGAIALGTGLLHSYTQSWEWPLVTLLIILCGQIVTGVIAGLPITVHAAPRGQPLIIPHPRQPSIPHPRQPSIPHPRQPSER
jgi:MFS transporter, CP family, cyanate transporter